MFILCTWLCFSSCLSRVMSSSCGIDNSPDEHVYEGIARIETYPWLGVLYYPHNNKRFTTAVVLVTRQIALASALDIDKLPKDDFRARARVVIGHNCSTGPEISIRDYNFHPDYSRGTFSAIALIQLETDLVKTELRPICPPPREVPFKQVFYAKVFSEDCNRSKMTIHKMMFVSTEECKTYYRRAELDIDTMWPTYTACARSVTKGYCVWRSGAILVAKVHNRWSLLGFGVYGPGCEAPARFLDYGMYREWVRRSIERIGRPAVTKVAPNYIVLRRSISNIQKFGICDEYEMKRELYTESSEINRFPYPIHLRDVTSKYYFNLTIIADVEYSCIVLRADYRHKNTHKTPKLRLSRYCIGPTMTPACYSGPQFIEMQFFVEIEFEAALKYSVAAYGRTVKAIDPLKARKYANVYSNKFPKLYNYATYKSIYRPRVKNRSYPLYGKKNMTSREYTALVIANLTKYGNITTTTKKKKKRMRFKRFNLYNIPKSRNFKHQRPKRPMFAVGLR